MNSRLRILFSLSLTGWLLTGCNAIEPKRPAWAMDDFPPPTRAPVDNSAQAKLPASVYASAQLNSPASMPANGSVASSQGNTPYVWDKLRSALMPPPASSATSTSSPEQAEPVVASMLPTEGLFTGTPVAGSEDKAPPMTASQMMDKLRASLPEITEEQMRNLAIAAGAAYVLSKSSTPAAATGTTTTTAAASTAIPDKTINLSPTVGMALEKVVWWGAYAGMAYMILDPLNPNWEIEQASFPKQTYHLSLKMKRFYSGGAGEARSVFQERAKQLMRQTGADGFNIIEYSEGLDSSVIGSQRVARGVIQLTNKAG